MGHAGCRSGRGPGARGHLSHALDVVELLVEEISRVPTLSPLFVLPEKGRVPPTIVTLLLSFLHTSGAIWSAYRGYIIVHLFVIA